MRVAHLPPSSHQRQWWKVGDLLLEAELIIGLIIPNNRLHHALPEILHEHHQQHPRSL